MGQDPEDRRADVERRRAGDLLLRQADVERLHDISAGLLEHGDDPFAERQLSIRVLQLPARDQLVGDAVEDPVPLVANTFNQPST